MAKIFSVVGRAGVARVFEPVGRALLRAGVSPDAVTVAGTVGVLVGAIGFLARGHLVTATVIVTLSAFTDLIDGAMARERVRAGGRPSRFGAFLDSTMDRVADGAIFAAVTWWVAVSGHPATAVAGMICLVAGQVVSYAKARAEGLGFRCDVGIAERAERLMLVGVGALLEAAGVPYALPGALWLLAVLSVVTVGQRVAYVHRQAAAEAGPDRPAGPPGRPAAGEGAAQGAAPTPPAEPSARPGVGRDTP
jgi:CDP-diacylglycerol--glycerol-3-phosphate 3-phosphatidyltransferase